MYPKRTIVSCGVVTDPKPHRQYIIKLGCGHVVRRPARTDRSALNVTRLECRHCPQIQVK